MLAATIFGSKLLKLPDTKLIITVVIIQLVAILGMGMSRLSAIFGNLKVLLGCYYILICICLLAFIQQGIVENGYSAEYYFYGLAALVGLVMGDQPLSRSTYSQVDARNKDTASFSQLL